MCYSRLARGLSIVLLLWPRQYCAMHCLGKDLDEQFDNAILISSINAVKEAIGNKIDLNKKIKFLNNTFLSSAIDKAKRSIIKNCPTKYKALEILELLLKHGADSNALGLHYLTPLNLSVVDTPVLEVIEILLYYGANPENKDMQGRTMFSWIKKYSVQVRKLPTSYSALLQKVKAKPSKELLYECIEKGRFTLVKLLLQRGIAVTESDYQVAQNKYNETQSMAYEIIGKLIKERLSMTTGLGLIAKHGIVGANVISHSGEHLELTQDIAEHIGSFLPFAEEQ